MRAPARGDKMEDVVFNGTENRRAMGFAEVAINFDNSDRPCRWNIIIYGLYAGIIAPVRVNI